MGRRAITGGVRDRLSPNLAATGHQGEQAGWQQTKTAGLTSACD